MADSALSIRTKTRGCVKTLSFDTTPNEYYHSYDAGPSIHAISTREHKKGRAVETSQLPGLHTQCPK